MTAKFHIPGIYSHFYLNVNLINLVHNRPEMFREGVEIASVYGTFPPAIWNGGRSFKEYVSLQDCRNIISHYNGRKVPVRFTFTNPMLEKRHLDDEFCNELCRMAENDMNEIIVFMPMLEEYIRKKYPKFKFTSTTCKQIEDADKLREELEKDYHYVVLDYNWNNHFDFLENIPHKEKCEFLVNAICRAHCPMRGKHYQFEGKQQIYINEVLPIAGESAFYGRVTISGAGDDGLENDFVCPYNTSIESGMKEETYISPDAVYEKYIPMGFSNFKIEGRTATDEEVLGEYIKYMVRPEYADEVREKMQPYLLR